MKKIITDLEKQTGLVAHDPERTKDFKEVEQISDDYFNNPGEYTAVNYDDRVEFLELSGYEITRENLINASLPRKNKNK